MDSENMTPVAPTSDQIGRERTMEEIAALQAKEGPRYVSELEKERERARNAGDLSPVLIQVQSNPLAAELIDWSLDPQAGKQHVVFPSRHEALAELKQRVMFHQGRGAVVYVQHVQTHKVNENGRIASDS